MSWTQKKLESAQKKKKKEFLSLELHRIALKQWDNLIFITANCYSFRIAVIVSQIIPAPRSMTQKIYFPGRNPE